MINITDWGCQTPTVSHRLPRRVVARHPPFHRFIVGLPDTHRFAVSSLVAGGCRRVTQGGCPPRVPTGCQTPTVWRLPDTHRLARGILIAANYSECGRLEPRSVGVWNPARSVGVWNPGVWVSGTPLGVWASGIPECGCLEPPGVWVSGTPQFCPD
jgi:hypothetical protein